MKKFNWAISTLVIVTLACKSISLQQARCPTSPAQLTIDDSATVSLPITDTLGLQNEPGLNKLVITAIPPETYVTVIGGPVCEDGYRWYEVNYYGQNGWAAEVGPDGMYNLIPKKESLVVSAYYIYDIYRVKDYVFMISGGIRRIPNTETLNALGIPESWIKEWDGDWPTSNWDFGPDVPDVKTDQIGLCDYKHRYLPETTSFGALPCGTTRRLSPIENWTIIKTGQDYYIFIFYERRLIPNSDTVEALDITENMVNNMDRTDADLLAIPQGIDIPDVNQDPLGFHSFKEQYGRLIILNSPSLP